MTALMIVYARIDDVDAFVPYVEAVQPLIARWGGRMVGRGVPPVILEGDWPWHTVGVLEFPSMEAAQEFWHSPEYGDVKTLRAGISEFQVVLTPSVA